MYVPQSYLAALVLLTLCMLGWGSWPNICKALPKWRIDYFYLDYTFGFLLGALICAATLGSTAAVGLAFLTRLSEAGRLPAGCALLAGFLWNAGNVLLLRSIMMAGLAVAFPIASVPALTLGVGISYWTQPIGNPLWLAASVGFLLLAGRANAAAYRRLGPVSETRRPKGVGFALAAGVLIGLFPPFVARAMSGHGALDPYTASLYFMLGALPATLISVPALLAPPSNGSTGILRGYLQGKTTWHLAGLLAGVIWSFGTVANFLSAKMVGMAISWGFASGTTLVAALWGIFLWREFHHAHRDAKVLMGLSLVLYVIGVSAVAAAYSAASIP